MAKTKRRLASDVPSSPASSRPALGLDDLDRQLIHILEQRARAIAVDAESHQADSVTRLYARTSAFLAETELGEGLPKPLWEMLFRAMDSACLASVRTTRVLFLGPEDSYSHLATLKYFGAGAELCPVASIAAVFEAVVRQEADFGVVPIENSTDGRVVDTLGMFLKHSVRICGEVQLPIHHNLLSRSPRNEIREVHSKPQALSQCRGWLAQNLPEAKLVEISSTAAAAKLAAERPGVAAVASIEAGTRYGLNVVQANIEDNRNNVTRFAILGSSPTQPTGNDKTAILFQVAHQPGALADTMNLFKKGGLNLTWIESFPLPGSTNEYLFFVELEGHAATPQVTKTLVQLGKRAQRLEILGSYPRSARPT